MKIFLKFKLCDMLRNVLEPLICAILMGCVGIVLLRICDEVIWQFIYIIVCALFYIILMLVLFKDRLNRDFDVFRTNYNMK